MDHDELVFVAELSSVNQDVARYIGRVLDLDRGRTEFTTSLPEAEQELASRLGAIARALDVRARSRNVSACVPGLTVPGNVLEAAES